MKRRTYLGLGAVALSSGCLGLTGRPTTNIAWIQLENNSDEARDLTVFIQRNEEEVFRETYQLGITAEQATLRVDDPVNETGHYTVYFDIDNQVVQLSPSEYTDVAEPCIGIQYTFHQRGTTGFDLEPVQEC